MEFKKIHLNGFKSFAEKTDFFIETGLTGIVGPNGCGKTPVIHSIAYAMGYPVRFRDDILEHCDSVILRAHHRGRQITFERSIGSDFHIELAIDNEDSQYFYNEKDIASFLFSALGLAPDALTSVKNEPTSPYLSTFLPLFYVDQDSGYTSAYKSPNSFIKDQYTEMVRLALGAPPKNSYEAKKHLIHKKKELTSVDIEYCKHPPRNKRASDDNL